MKCPTHPSADAVAYCGQCGRALCAECRHEVRGMIYCENCLAARLQSPSMLPPILGPGAGPQPGLALFLGFIPGVGALVLLKQHIDDPVVDARIGLAGPLWGLGAGLAAFAVYMMTRIPIWGAIAELTGFINLFNLIPIWQLDGSRGFHALSQWQRLAVVGVVALALFATGQGLLIILGLVAVFRAFQKTATAAGDRHTLVTFVVLVGALSWLARGVG